MRTRKTVVILLSGKAKVGKTTAAEILEQKLKEIPGITIMRYGFAEPLKYIAKSFIGWNGEKDEAGRRLLQKQGAIGREYDQNIWVKHFLGQLDKRAGMLPFNFAIIDDWRFPNEVEYLKKNPLLDVVTIRLFGRGGLNGEVAEDVSENSLPEITPDWDWINNTTYNFGIENNKDIESLSEMIDLTLHEIEKQYIVE